MSTKSDVPSSKVTTTGSGPGAGADSARAARA